MNPSIYQIPIDTPGRLFQMPKPSGEWLREDVAYYSSLGIDLIVSMLEAPEAADWA